MRNRANPVLVVLGLLALAWALTMLKPMPQGAVLVAVAAALAVERWAPRRARPATFVSVASLAALLGYVIAGSELLAHAQRWLFPAPRRVMPLFALVVGASIGAGLFVWTFISVIRPLARLDVTRRTGLVAIGATGVLACGLDALA